MFRAQKGRAYAPALEKFSEHLKLLEDSFQPKSVHFQLHSGWIPGPTDCAASPACQSLPELEVSHHGCVSLPASPSSVINFIVIAKNRAQSHFHNTNLTLLMSCMRQNAGRCQIGIFLNSMNWRVCELMLI